METYLQILSIIFAAMAVITVIADYILKRKRDKQLLRIELDEYDSVPRVYHRGERLDIKGLIRAKFDWETDDDEYIKLPEIFIKHLDVDEEGKPVIEEFKMDKVEMERRWDE